MHVVLDCPAPYPLQVIPCIDPEDVIDIPPDRSHAVAEKRIGASPGISRKNHGMVFRTGISKGECRLIRALKFFPQHFKVQEIRLRLLFPEDPESFCRGGTERGQSMTDVHYLSHVSPRILTGNPGLSHHETFSDQGVCLAGVDQ